MIKTLFFFIIFTSAYSQIPGCTDPISKNFNQNATINNGICEYKSIKIKPLSLIKLSDSIRETSGLISFDNLLWTHNDDHDKTIYGLDTLGRIIRKLF